MRRKTVPIPILIFIWLVIIGGVFWWWQSRGGKEVEEKPSFIEKSGPVALVETEPLKEKSLLSDERRIADLKQVRAAYEIYYDEHGKYPDWPEDDLVPDYFASKSAFQNKNIYYMGYGDQKLCLWIELKEKNGFYVISHCGEKETQKSPSGSFDYCCELTNLRN